MGELIPQVNLGSAPQVRRVGREQTPLILIDDFVSNLIDVIDYGCREVRFELDTVSAYPGVRAGLGRRHVIETIRPLVPLLYDVYSIPMTLRLKPKNYVFSLVATPADDLLPGQRVPHTDSNAPFHFAITHYLSENVHGGTGLFRHVPTGFENITEDRIDEYSKSADAFMDARGGPPEGYVTASDDHYELFEAIDYRPNRLIIYPGTLLHSGLIDPATDVSRDPATGRLTTNIFVKFQ